MTQVLHNTIYKSCYRELKYKPIKQVEVKGMISSSKSMQNSITNYKSTINNFKEDRLIWW